MASPLTSEASWGEKEDRESEESSLGREVQLSDDDFSLDFGPSLHPMHCWKKLSSCEEFVGAKRSKHTIVAWNEKMYVFGGDNGRRMLNDFLVSHIRDCSWARVVFTGEFCQVAYITKHSRCNNRLAISQASLRLRDTTILQ